jgi:hypothetical protein
MNLNLDYNHRVVCYDHDIVMVQNLDTGNYRVYQTMYNGDCKRRYYWTQERDWTLFNRSIK